MWMLTYHFPAISSAACSSVNVAAPSNGLSDWRNYYSNVGNVAEGMGLLPVGFDRPVEMSHRRWAGKP